MDETGQLRNSILVRVVERLPAVLSLRNIRAKPATHETSALRNSASHEIIREQLKPLYSGIPAEVSVTDELIADGSREVDGIIEERAKTPTD